MSADQTTTPIPRPPGATTSPASTHVLPSAEVGDREADSTAPRCPGVSRNAEWPQSVLFFFDRVLSDDQIRFLHDVVQRACACMSSDTTPTGEVIVTRNPDGYVTVSLEFGSMTFYLEASDQKFSAYLKGAWAESPTYFEGEIDAAE